MVVDKHPDSEGHEMSIALPDMVIFTDASTSQGWGAHMEGGPSTGGRWSQEERGLHINVLELLAVEIAVKTFLRIREAKSIHLRIDNFVALTYLVKMGGTKSPHLCAISQRIWEFLLAQGVSLTASWIPSELNVEADRESRRNPNSSEWALNQGVFRQVCQKWGRPEIDAFASRIMHQLQSYWSLDLDPESLARDAMRQSWTDVFLFLFPPFCLLGRVLAKVRSQECPKAILIAPVWPGQPWYPMLLHQLIAHPILLPPGENLLEGTKGEPHPLASSLTLGAFLVTGLPERAKAYQTGLYPFSSMLKDQAQSAITRQPGRSGVFGVVAGKPIPSTHL